MISRLVRSADCLAIAEIYNLGISEYGQRLGPNAARYIVGEVVVVHVDESLQWDQWIDSLLVKAIARMSGSD